MTQTTTPTVSPETRERARSHAAFTMRPKVVTVLTEMLTRGQNPDWIGLGSSPVSYVQCRFCTEGIAHTGFLCSHEQRTIERYADEIVNGDQHEYRLNGAGLKLYTRGVRVGYDLSVTFSMNVWGDQRADYPQFVEFANARLDELQLRHYDSASTK